MSSVQLDHLPVDFFEKIIQYLSLKECVRLERVNSEWRKAMRKEWRRVKIVDFRDDPFFSGIIDTLNDKNNDSACVDLGMVCLQEFAVKIHSYVQEIIIFNDELDNRQVAVFLKKFVEFSTPRLTKLTLHRDCKIFNEGDEKVMTDIAQCIPLTLESLELRFFEDKGNAFKYFWDGFSQRTFTQLKILEIRYSGDSSFRMNALQILNLKELRLIINLSEDEKDQLSDLETLRCWFLGAKLSPYPPLFQTHTPASSVPASRAANRSVCRILETVTSNDCKFLKTLKELFLYGYCNDEQLLSQIGRFSALERLHVPWMEDIDTAGLVRIVRSIGQGCAYLKSFDLDYAVEDEVLIEVADWFHSLSDLYVCKLGAQQLVSFVNRLSIDRCIEIHCENGPTEAEVQASGILKFHPNIRYRYTLG